VIPFQIGDRVTVHGVPASEWRNGSGVIVNIVDREQDGELTQECAVQFPAARRWFLAKDLSRSTPAKWVRFFRYEASERWPGLSLDDLAALSGNRDELISLLQERCGLTLRRAGAEADSFISEIQERLHIAMQPVLERAS
jgi:hypothetical protein